MTASISSNPQVPASPQPLSLESTSPDPILTLFQKNRLLVRAMEPSATQSVIDTDCRARWDFTVWDREGELLQDALKNASSTLLVEGRQVHTYKPYGVLFNGETAEILHCSTMDNNSYTDSNGLLHTLDPTNRTLPELAEYILTTPLDERAAMNEVNANFRVKDLIGLFVNRCESRTPYIDILIMQTHIQKAYGLSLPVYEYDAINGRLKPYQPSAIEKTQLLMSLRKNLPVARLATEFLGGEMNERGRFVKAPL